MSTTIAARRSDSTPPSSVRAVQIIGPDQLALLERPVPAAHDRMSLAAPAFVGLCGTDLDLLHGTMPYFAEGRARYPLQPGHEWSGHVLLTPSAELGSGRAVVMDLVVGCGTCERCARGPATRCQERFELGVRNGMDGALATAIAVPTANLVPVPAMVALRDAVLVEPLVTVLAGIAKAAPVEGDQALVVGAGTLGLLAAMILSSRGLRPHVLYRDPVRIPAIEEAGGVPWRVGDRPGVASFDVVIEAAGTVDGVQHALGAAGPGGRVALLGVPALPVEVDIATLVLNDGAVFGILNGPGQYHAALDAIAAGAVRADVLVDRVFPLVEAEAAFRRAQERGRARPKVLIQVAPDADLAVAGAAGQPGSAHD